MDDRNWDELAKQHMKEWKEMQARLKTVWLNVSIELDCEGLDDEAIMNYANDIAVDAGFIVDDMGMTPVIEVKDYKEDKA